MTPPISSEAWSTLYPPMITQSLIICRPKNDDGEVDVSQLVKACKVALGEPVDYERVMNAFKANCSPSKGSFNMDDLNKV
jgi:hypothetical protein